jgi:hypothetical protein
MGEMIQLKRKVRNGHLQETGGLPNHENLLSIEGPTLGPALTYP